MTGPFGSDALNILGRNTDPSDYQEHSKAYYYDPNLAAAIIFAVLFGLTLAMHMYQATRYRTAYIWVLIVAIWIEFIGYALRVVSIKKPDSLAAGIISSTTIVVAPAFMAAAEYMVVGRIMAFVGSKYSFISHQKITGVFVGADIFAILMQGSGGGLLASADGDVDKLKLAKNVLLAGLALQVITFGIFLVVAIVYDVRSSRAPELKSHMSEMRRLRALWTAFYVTGLLITLRSIYRTIEFGSISFTAGSDDPVGYVLTHEYLHYVLDAVPIFITAVLLSIYHPGKYLPNKKGLRIDGTYEEQSPRRWFCCCGPEFKQREPRGRAEAVPLREV